MKYLLNAIMAVMLAIAPSVAFATTAPPTVNLGAITSGGVGQQFMFGFDTTNAKPRAIAVDPTGAIFCNNCTGGGGGGGAVTAVAGAFVDGALATEGTKADAAYTGTGSATEIAIEKGIYAALVAGIPVTGAFYPATQPVSGTFWQATQPVSAVSLPLPSGAATSANQVVPTAAGTSGANAASIQGISGGVAVPVSGTFWQTTQPVSIASNVPTYLTAQSSGGAAFSRAINSASSAMATSIKASGGQVYFYRVCNSNATAVYFRLYNLPAAPTVGSTTGIVDTEYVAGTSCVNFSTDVGLLMGTGIAYDVTAGSFADTDTTTITAASTVSVTIGSK